MRLLTYRLRGATHAGRQEGNVAVELPYADVGEILSKGALEAARTATGPRHDVSDLQLAAPVLTPAKIVCVGQNFVSHIDEQGIPMPRFPTIFTKWQAAMIDPYADIVLPPESTQNDWEVELAYYIGKRIRRAEPDEALDAIAGYTVVNDVSMRDWQFHTTQFTPGKNFEASTPVGPCMVTPDEIDPLNLTLRCSVNGTVMQNANTDDFLFKPAEVASYVSTFITLEPGDLVSMGTPGGVGVFRKPPVFLKSGDVVRTEVVGIGELVNRCMQDPAQSGAPGSSGHRLAAGERTMG